MIDGKKRTVQEAMMFRRLLTIVILFVMVSLAYGQTPVIEWETVIGADGGDNVTNIFQLEDG